MSTALPYAHTSTDQCYRCGYDLHGIADDHACPECGLLAVRSRRASDELHETRPKWLRSISFGVNFIFWSIVLMIGWCFAADAVSDSLGGGWGSTYDLGSWVAYGGFLLIGGMFTFGMYLLTRREGYPPTDDADRWLRWWLWLQSLIPLAVILLIHNNPEVGPRDILYGYGFRQIGWHTTLVMALATLGVIPLPLLLCIQLRGLAKRARSAHLAEHCIVVGAGATLSLLVVFGVYELFLNATQLGFGPDWQTTGPASMTVLLVASVGSSLFVLWTIYLLFRFATAFKAAARELRYKWNRDDLSLDDRPKQLGFPLQLDARVHNPHDD